MKLSDLNNKKIAFLGLGIENVSLVKFLLSKKIKADFTICDQRSKTQLQLRYTGFSKNKKIKWQLGKNYDSNLESFDIIIRSPGYPLFTKNILKAKKAGTKITSPIKLFFSISPTKNIIGVTGTKGKGTTASLIHFILKSAGKDSYIGGNIGIPVFDFFKKLKKNSWVVLELSSFHLEDLDVSPKISVITNFYKEHLAPADTYNPNFHKSLAGYWKSKLNIAKLLDKKNITIVNKSLKKKIQGKKLNSKIIYFSKSNLPSKLVGEHNKENIDAAIKVAKLIGIKEKNIADSVTKFKGLEHRLEFVKKTKQVKFFNDSFATTEESAITAIESFNQPIILLAGGADKGADFKKLVKKIKNKVKYVVLFDGDATPKLKKALLSINYSKTSLKTVHNMKQAVKTSFLASKPNDIILLSPACASFGMFKNYKERGKLFKKEVKLLK